MNFITDYLKAMHDLMIRHDSLGHRMDEGTQFAKILTHGRPFALPSNGKPRPAKMKKRKNGECFANATRLSLEYSDLIYVEGYALPKEVPVAIHHAWLTTTAGFVIDPTWSTLGAEYFGIPFNEEYHLRSMRESGYYSILDNYRWRDFMAHGPEEFLFKGEIHAYHHSEKAAA